MIQISVFTPTEVLLSNALITLATDRSQNIYMKISGSGNRMERTWLMLRRDGMPIPADRGNYMLTDAELNGNSVLITDTNEGEGIAYQWKIDANTGIFEGQTMVEIR